MNNDKGEVEINFIELGKKLWYNKKIIIKFSILGIIVGIIIAFSIPKEYTSTVILTTESSKTVGGSSMSTLASIAGINMGVTGSEDIFSPELYPDVLKSTPFVQGLLNINVVDEKHGVNTTLYNYIENEQSFPWWNYIFKIPFKFIDVFSDKKKSTTIDAQNKTPGITEISDKEMNVIIGIRERYFIETDKKTGITTLEVTMQSPTIAAYLADTIISYLQSYIISQRTKKANLKLDQTKNIYEKSKKEYYQAQQGLATFLDANHNVTSSKYRINEEKLRNEAQIAFTVYNQMAQQVQIAQMNVLNDTPIFITIQPPVTPLFSTAPQKKIIILTITFISILISSAYVLKDTILILFASSSK